MDWVSKVMGRLFHLAPSVLAAIAMPPAFMKMAQQCEQVTFLHLRSDPLCCVEASSFCDTFKAFREVHIAHAKCAMLTSTKKHDEWFRGGHDIAHLIPIAAQLAAFTEVNEACLAFPMMVPAQQLAYLLALITSR